MIYRSIGDARVSAISLGTANLSLDATVSSEEADRTIDAAVEVGVTFVDTAAAYATRDDPRHAERLVARARKRHPELFVATKGGHTRAGDSWSVDGRPASIRRDCEQSLAVLQAEQIDLYYLHKPDPEVPFLDSVGELAALQREGKIAGIGLSNVSVHQLRAAREVVQVDVVQNSFSPVDRSDLDCLRECERLGVAYVIYSPLGGPSGSAGLVAAFPRTARLAAVRGNSLQSTLLAWELSISDGTIPTVGSRHPASIRDSASAAELTLDDEVKRAITLDQAAQES